MNRKKSKEKAKVMTFRIPYSVYDAYEIRCIEEQITMTKLLRETILNYMGENKSTNFNSLVER